LGIIGKIGEIFIYQLKKKGLYWIKIAVSRGGDNGCFRSSCCISSTISIREAFLAKFLYKDDVV